MTRKRATLGGSRRSPHVETVIDNGKPSAPARIRFETGPSGPQAAGSVTCLPGRRDDAAVGDHRRQAPQGAVRLLPPHHRRRGADVRRGPIPGSFFRREGRPGEDAILTCRLIDRPLRPTFVKGLRNEIQVVITVLALDPDQPYDVLAINAASMSTQLSGLPFSGPIGGVRVALIEGQWVAFPTTQPARERRLRHGRRGPHRDRHRRRRDHDGRGRGHRGDRGTWSPRAVPRPPPRRSWPSGLEAAKPFIKQLCEAQSELAKRGRPSPSMDFPLFLDYEDDVFEAVEAAASVTDLSPAMHDRRQGRARDAATRRAQGRRRWPARPASSRAARRRSARRSARSKKLVRASASCATRCASTVVASPTSAAARRGRRHPAGARLGAVRAR